MKEETQVNIPFYEKYPTPLFDREESHKHFHGSLYEYEFEMKYTSPVDVINKIIKDNYFEKHLKQLRSTNLKKRFNFNK